MEGGTGCRRFPCRNHAKRAASMAFEDAAIHSSTASPVMCGGDRRRLGDAPRRLRRRSHRPYGFTRLSPRREGSFPLHRGILKREGSPGSRRFPASGSARSAAASMAEGIPRYAFHRGIPSAVPGFRIRAQRGREQGCRGCCDALSIAASSTARAPCRPSRPSGTRGAGHPSWRGTPRDRSFPCRAAPARGGRG